MTTAYLYFLQQKEGGAVKIGITTNLKDRITSIQTANPNRLVLLHHEEYESIDDARNHEQYLHQLFKHFCIGGEWFLPKPFLIERIECVKRGGIDNIPEAQTTLEDYFTHYECFDLIADNLSEIYYHIRQINKKCRQLARIGKQYQQHGDEESKKYIGLELEDTMEDLIWIQYLRKRNGWAK